MPRSSISPWAPTTPNNLFGSNETTTAGGIRAQLVLLPYWALIFCFLDLHDNYCTYDAFNHLRRRGAPPQPRVPTKYHLPSSAGATGRISDRKGKKRHICLGSIHCIPSTVHQFLILHSSRRDDYTGFLGSLPHCYFFIL